MIADTGNLRIFDPATRALTTVPVAIDALAVEPFDATQVLFVSAASPPTLRIADLSTGAMQLVAGGVSTGLIDGACTAGASFGSVTRFAFVAEGLSIRRVGPIP